MKRPYSGMESAAAAIEGSVTIEALYRADAERLWRALLAFSGDPDVSSDALAEAYAQVIKRGYAVADPQAWTWRVAFRIAAGTLKDRRRKPLQPAEREYRDRYSDLDLLTALASLPAGQRAAVTLFYYADLPTREIARRLGTNALVVRANLSRGRRRLRQLLGDQDG